MSDSVKKYYEDLPENELKAIEIAREKELEVRKYLWVLDFEMGRVFMYNIRRADLEHEDYEDLMTLKGHKPTNCQWMVCESNKIYN